MSVTLSDMPVDDTPVSRPGRGRGRGRGRGMGRGAGAMVRRIPMDALAPDADRWKGSCVLVPAPGETAGVCHKGRIEPCPPEVWPRCEAQRSRLNMKGDI